MIRTSDLRIGDSSFWVVSFSMAKTFTFLFVITFSFFGMASQASAADHYVRAAATGSADGSDWANAWPNVTNIVWASIAPGDTIWIAGGSYGALVVDKSGNADSDAGRIFIKRATVAAHGAETGWNASYDTQVLLAKIAWTKLNVGSYLTIDGQVPNGIRISVLSGGGAAVIWDRGSNYVTLRNLDLAGPCGEAPCVQGGDTRGIDMTPYNGSSYDLVDHFKLQYSEIHGFCTLMFLLNADNAVIEHNDIYDSTATDTAVSCHPNVLYTSGADNFTLRYNKIHNYLTEGIIMSSSAGVSGAWYIYGNLWYRGGDNSVRYDRVIETRAGENGPVFFYNNTVVGLWATWNNAGGTWAPGSVSKNNIYWNLTSNWPQNSSYDFCSGTCSGTNSISNGSNPFVDLSTFNFHLTSAIGATYPRDKGIDLGVPYNVDADGTTRSGAWDIGAYQFASPMFVTPTPTPTPTPTVPSPTPTSTPTPSDTTPPSISLISPTSGFTISGSVSLEATASDNTGVTGVQFLLDGIAFTSELTTSPYRITWDTTMATNGSHTLTAIAHDAAGNQAMSSGVVVTVSNTTASTPVSTPTSETTQTPVPTPLKSPGLSESQIQAILSLLSSFGAGQSIISAVTLSLRGSSSPLSPQSLSFTHNLSLYQNHTDVKTLQQFLNTHGFLVATSGPGSPESENTYFGTKTYAALIKFQKSRGLPATGWFGPLTRGETTK